MSKQINTVAVKALQAYETDVGRNIARIDERVMDALRVSTNGFLEILGKRRTASKCMPLYPSDSNKGLMKIDGLIRHNASLAIGDTAEIRKAEPSLAEKIVLASFEEETHSDERHIVEILNGTPVTTGDKVMIPFGLRWKLLEIVRVTPLARVHVVGNKTRVEQIPSIV